MTKDAVEQAIEIAELKKDVEHKDKKLDELSTQLQEINKKIDKIIDSYEAKNDILEEKITNLEIKVASWEQVLISDAGERITSLEQTVKVFRWLIPILISIIGLIGIKILL